MSQPEAHGAFVFENTNISELSGEGEARDEAQDHTTRGLEHQAAGFVLDPESPHGRHRGQP